MDSILATNFPSLTPLVSDPATYRKFNLDNLTKPEKITGEVPKEISSGIFRDPEKYIRPLVRFLISGTENVFLRVKRIHDWIALNIEYDAASFLRRNIPGQSYVETLKRRKSVCQGYAEVFAKMCAEGGIKAIIVSGYARGYGYKLLGGKEKIESDHAWNIVLVEGNLYLIDSTWDSGHLDKRDQFKREYSTNYLFTDPRIFLLTHYPGKSQYQLLAHQVAENEFHNLPYLKPEFFTSGIEFKGPLAKIVPVAARHTVEFSLERDMILSAEIQNSAGAIVQNACFPEHDDGKARLHMAFPAPGKWAVDLFHKPRTATIGAHFGSFAFEVRDRTAVCFAATYAAYNNISATLLAPLEGPLIAGRETNFNLTLPGMKSVAFSADDGNLVVIENAAINAGNFRFSVKIPRCRKLTIYAGGDSSQQYQGLLAYKVK